MANISKSFSFRNGVQVDDDDLVVRSSLVGIGTTVPTETLDVRGTTRLVGFTTMVGDLQVSGVSTFANKVAIGTQVSINSGFVTAVKFYGDGSTLSNLPTSQWIDVDVGLGFTSIYVQGNVGVGTTDPQRLMQIGGNPDRGQTGTLFDIKGNIYSTGVATATRFIGIGSDLTILNASNLTLGTVSNDRLPVLENSRIPNNFQVSGIITSLGGFIGTVTGNVVGNVTGNVTGIASTARSLTGTPDITVGLVNATTVSAQTLSATGIVSTSSISVGASGTSFNVTSTGRVGIGSSVPTADFQIVKPGNVHAEVISTSAESSISIGKTGTTGDDVSLLRYGNYLSDFDIINRSPGSINLYLHGGNAGLDTGRFSWIYGQTNDELMSLTYNGRLGLGITNPANTLHVVGTSTITSNSFVGGDLRVLGQLRLGISGQVIGGGSGIFDTNIFATSGVSTVAEFHVLNSGSLPRVGIGTSSPIVGLDARETTALFNIVGVNTDIVSDGVDFVVEGTSVFTQIGIGTTAFYSPGVDDSGGSLQIFDNSLNLYNSSLYLSNSTLGVGTNFTRAIVDFGKVGAALTPIGYMIVPTMNDANVSGLATSPLTTVGGIVFNETTSEFLGISTTTPTGVALTSFALGGKIGIASAVTLNVAGVSTFNGITTVTGPTLFTKQLNASGVATASQVKVGTGVTISAGIVTATNGFLSGIGTAVQIATVGNQLVFTVPGVGSTSFTLF